MTTGIDVLRTAFSTSCDTLRRVLGVVSDAEFFWEPVGGCWTVHRRSQDRGVDVDGAGEWVLDYDPSQPRPAPFTTIAWRTVHIARTNYLYWDYAFGALTDADLDLLVLTNWGKQWPLHRIFATLINEQVHHGAEISLLRGLYRCRDSLAAQG